MAKDVAGSIRYFVSVNQEYKDVLATLRQWNNLKVAFDDGLIWVSDFDYEQIHSTAVKSIPFKSVYYEKDSKLFLMNSRLPERSLPAVLWTSIDRAFPLTLPSLNHNYFGITESVSIQVVESEVEADAVAMITSIDRLNQYVATAPAIRLANLRWAVIDRTKALLIGKPLLPIPGETYWQRKDLLLPSGYDLDLFLVADILQKRLSPGRQNWVCLEKDNTCFQVPKESMMPLSISSFRQTIESTY